MPLVSSSRVHRSYHNLKHLRIACRTLRTLPTASLAASIQAWSTLDYLCDDKPIRVRFHKDLQSLSVTHLLLRMQTEIMATRWSRSRSKRCLLGAAALPPRARTLKIPCSTYLHRSWFWKGKILMTLWIPIMLPRANWKVTRWQSILFAADDIMCFFSMWIQSK